MSTISWTNSAGGDWGTGSNWSGGVVPTAADDAVIALPGTYTISTMVGFGALFSAHSVTLNDPGAILSFGMESTLALGGQLLIDAGTFDLSGTIAGGTIEVIGGTFAPGYAGTLSGVTVEGTLTPSTSLGSGLLINGGLTLEGAGGIGSGALNVNNGYLTFIGSQTLSGGTIALASGFNSASLTEAVTGTLTLAPNLIVTASGNNDTISGDVVNEGLVSIPSDAKLSIGGGTFVNAGTVVIAPGGNLNLSASLTDTGTITGAAGTVTVSGAATDAELASLAASGASIILTGVLANAGGTLSVGQGGAVPLLTLGSGGVISNGIVQDAGGGLVAGGGTLSDVTYEGTFIARGGEANFPYSTIVNDLTLLNSSGTGPGVLDVEGGVAFASTESIAGGTIILGGTGYATEAGLGYNPGLQIAVGSVLTFGSLAVVSQTGLGDDISGNLINQGLVQASRAGGGFGLDSGSTLTNQGTIIVSGGDTFVVSGSLANAGTLVIGAGGTLDMAGGAISNTGSVLFAGGVLELTGTVTPAQLQADALLRVPILFNGTIDDTGGTLAVGAGEPITTLSLGRNGVIRNGTLFDNGGFVAAGGTLDGVAYQGTGLTVAAGQLLPIADRITLTGITGTGSGLLVVDQTAEVLFDNTQTLDNAVVQLAGALVAGNYGPGSGTLTLGSGVTIEGTGSSSQLGGSVANAGSIVASGTGNSLTVSTLINTGSVSVTNGAVLNLCSLGTLTNTGQISETNATLRFYGPIDLPTINTIHRNGGIVALSFLGNLALGGGVLNVGNGTALGQLRDNGVIANGTIADAGGGMVFYGGAVGELENVTYRGLLSLTPALSSLIVQGLTVTGAGGTGPGTVNVLGAGSALTFQGSQTLDNATINFGSNAEVTTLTVSDPTGTGAVFTLGAHADIQQRGAMAQIAIGRGLGDALVNDGLIAANAPGTANGNMIILGGTLTNAGRMIVTAGNKISLEADQVSNLVAGMLTGGYWEVDANATLNLGMDTPLVTLNAPMVLNGAGSQVLYNNTSTFQTTSLEQTLHYVGAAATLVLENGRAFNDPGLLYVNGQVILAGGTLSGAPIAVGTGGLIYGSGAIAAGAIYDSGNVLAQNGQLVLNAPLLPGAPVGGALIAAGATLAANQAVAVPVRFLAATGTLALGQAASVSGSISGFTANDAIDLVNVGTAGVSLSYAPGAGNGMLTVKTGAATDATLHFSGNYLAGNFRFTSDGHGGTLILDPPVPTPTLTGADWKLTLGDLAAPPSSRTVGSAAQGGTIASGFGMATPPGPAPAALLVPH